MATASTNSQRKKETQVPPRRGQIKAQIFESMVRTVFSAASKAKEALGKKLRRWQRWPVLFLYNHHSAAKWLLNLKDMVTSLVKNSHFEGNGDIS
ncbi:hypothetical protein DITRI_Ditri05aG0022100 [Diplodiscus trichospermus]